MMINLMALWVGRAVLFILTLTVFIIICNFLRIACRRPYYCIKHLLPWKRKDENEWVEFVDYHKKNNPKRKVINTISRYSYYYEFCRYGKIGIMTNVEHGRWWEPKRRFFWIKKR